PGTRTSSSPSCGTKSASRAEAPKEPDTQQRSWGPPTNLERGIKAPLLYSAGGRIAKLQLRVRNRGQDAVALHRSQPDIHPGRGLRLAVRGLGIQLRGLRLDGHDHRGSGP